MPRRPRPASRRPPKSALAPLENDSSSSKLRAGIKDASTSRQSTAERNTRLSSDPEPDENVEDESGGSSVSDLGDLGETVEEEDLDTPRVAQWVDEEELDGIESNNSSDVSSEEEADGDLGIGPSEGPHIKTLQDDLSLLPLGALRKAQRALGYAKAENGSQRSESSIEDTSEPEEASAKPVKGKGKEKPRHEIQKRKHKHAPMEMSSKRPVSRNRPIIEEKKLVPRDPRFLPLAGEFSSQKFRAQYDFLAELHEGEMKTLKENLKRARKLLLTSPRDLREEREQEVQRLERAAKRAESMVNQDRRDRIEQTALGQVAKEERERRKQGKGAWFMKTSDKKELLVRAKYDALAAAGGKAAVKKAIEKKQKKTNEKEKKKRPFAQGSSLGARVGSHGESYGKRPHAGGSEGQSRPSKRQRTG